MERRRLAKKFFLLAGVVSVLVLCVYLAWFYHAQSIENDRRALAEARVLSAEIGAAWDYIDAVQPQINRATGETSGIYCAVAAKDIAKRFSAGSAYSIRYIRGNPRNTEDAPMTSSARRFPPSRRASLKSTTGSSIKETVRSSAMWACLK